MNRPGQIPPGHLVTRSPCHFASKGGYMFKRLFSAAAVAMLLASYSGCCCLCCQPSRSFSEQEVGRHWCCSQCGETYWSEWFNDPPDCCEPCNHCGHFTGHCGCCSGCGPSCCGSGSCGGCGYGGPMANGPSGYDGPGMDEPPMDGEMAYPAATRQPPNRRFR